MKIHQFIAALVAVLFVPVAWAQAGAGAAPQAAVPRVGVINVQMAITTTAEGKQAAQDLQAQFAPRQSELENLRKQVDDVQTRLRTGATTLSDDEKARLSRQGDQLTRTLQRKEQDFQDDGTEAQREVVDRIGRKMLDVLDRYAKENGFGIVLDTSAQNTPVVYAANQMDITQQIVQLYDQTYPMKAAGPAPKAPAAHPAPANP